MNCLTVRDRLAEHALGVLQDGGRNVGRSPSRVVRGVPEGSGRAPAGGGDARLLRWRRRSPRRRWRTGWSRAVRDAAGRRRAAAPRRSRVAAAVVLAAMLALSGPRLGRGDGGACRARRGAGGAQPHRAADAVASSRMCSSCRRSIPSDRRKGLDAALTSAREGRGDALVLLSPSGDDLAIVVGERPQRGASQPAPARGPARRQRSAERARSSVEIRTLNSGGEGGVYRVVRPRA